MVNDMTVPEKIGDMLEPVYPVTGKVQCKKGNDIYDDGIGNMCQGKMFEKKRIGEYNEIKPDNIFGYVGNATAQAADHIHVTYSIFAFSPAIPFFK